MYLVPRIVFLCLSGSSVASMADAMPPGWTPILPIAQINPAWSAVGSLLVAGAIILRHSAKFRK